MSTFSRYNDLNFGPPYPRPISAGTGRDIPDAEGGPKPFRELAGQGGHMLGVGPREEDRSNRPSTYDARLIFLRLLDGYVPPEVVAGLDGSNELKPSDFIYKNEVPADLCDNVLPSFAALVCDRFWGSLFTETPVRSFTSGGALYRHLKSRISPEEAKTFVPDHAALKRESPETYELLVAWAKPKNINVDWCLDYAVDALRFWLFDRAARELKVWSRARKRDVSGLVWDAVIEHAFQESREGKLMPG